MTFAFHISREARRRFGVDEELFTLTGNVVLPNIAAGRRLARDMNEQVDPEREPERVVHAGQLNAMGLLDELLHAVIAVYREQVNPRAMADALAAVGHRLGAGRLETTLEAFVDRYPTAESMRHGTPAAEYLAASTDGISNREIAIEELLMLWLANANPALNRFRELFDDSPLVEAAPYGELVAGLIAYFATQPPVGPDGQTLIEMLRAPALAVPDSIAGQLQFVRERWAMVVTRLGDRLLITLDVLAEEEQGIWRRIHPPELADRREASAERTGQAWLIESGWHGAGAGEPEAENFSVDRDWMPRLVLVAKSAFVWLDQLSRTYGRRISRLDELPDEELDRLARWGFTGLWLIGLWQRSRASQTIKQLRGNPEAVASAYSLDDYRIADDLGGEAAFENLKARAWARGIRIASDMVPNHMGIDSHWVMEHPDWFMSVPEPPYPAYSFTGPDLSNDDRAGIQIEDHYFDNTDASVVFRRLDRATGVSQYIYHGNDGTSMPWNDTAQLDYLKPEVREAVIQTILAVARRSPVIRFDAAMTLARRHVERLWYPEPGQGGGIPSRAEHALSKAEFERLMPAEFWREVVDRVAAEVPDTLLLAEAFWLMEGYFVRTLGMHRVYNSAFMNMLRDEENANYRSVIRNTIEFDPEVLKRYVNFMNNPDERTAVDQFGKGDKYFGVATLMATLPGLPMFGHGQVEGFTEKYGMEYRRAYRDEHPDPVLVERHERDIAPLLQRRSLFADVDDFLLFDFVRDDGSVDEDVFAYSNRGGGESSLIVYNNRYEAVSGRIRESVPYAARTADGGRTLTQRSLADGLGLHGDRGWYVAMRDWRAGVDIVRASDEIHADGLRLDLGAYSCRVFLGIREVQDSAAQPWARLAGELAGRGVANLDDALHQIRLGPVQDPVRRLLDPNRLLRVAQAPGAAATSDLVDDLRQLIDAARELAGGPPDAAVRSAEWFASQVVAGLSASVPRAGDAAGQSNGKPAHVAESGDAIVASVAHPGAPSPAEAAQPSVAHTGPEPPENRVGVAQDDAPQRVLLAAWLVFRHLPAAIGSADTPDRGRAWIDEWRLTGVVAESFRAAGLAEADAWRAVVALKALLTLPAWELGRPVPERVARILAAWLADDAVARVIRANVYRDVRWFNREAFMEFAAWVAAAERIRRADGEVAPTPGAAGSAPDVGVTGTGDRPSALDVDAVQETVDALAAAAARSGYRLDALPVSPAVSQPDAAPASAPGSS